MFSHCRSKSSDFKLECFVCSLFCRLLTWTVFRRGWLISAALGLVMLTHDFESSWQTGYCLPQMTSFICLRCQLGELGWMGRLGLSFHWCLTPGRPSSLRRLAQLIPKMSVFQRVTMEATSALKLGSHTGHLSLLLIAKVANSDSSNWKIDSISCKKKLVVIFDLISQKGGWKTLGWGKA